MKILDTTLRDGSYVIDFQFTSRDTAIIATCLDKAGVHYIELGHGLGLGASRLDGMRQPDPDESYLEAAGAVVKHNKWGMFFIPGIGNVEDIELAARYGMKFIRIGTNVTEIERSESFIRRAKELGMEVFANYMKTYASSPEDVAERAILSALYGADHVCIVDSAGGMLPEDVAAYVRAIKQRSDVAINFHGHNNLGLAIANSLSALDAGASVIDTSIRGMGRSAGNAVTEIFLLTLKRKGIELGIDVTAILDIAEKHIDPLLKNHQQVDSIGVISGYAQFHSSFLGKILDYATRYRIDPRELIVRVANVDRVNAPDDLLSRLSQELADEQKGGVQRIFVELPEALKGKTSNDLTGQTEIVVSQAVSLSRKLAKSSVFNLAQVIRKGACSFVSPVIHEGSQYIVASGEASDIADAVKIAEALEGTVDYLLLDTELKNEESHKWVSAVANALKKTTVLSYCDTEVWARTAVALVRELTGNLFASTISVLGNNVLATMVSERLDSHCKKVLHITNGEAKETTKFLVMCMPFDDLDLDAMLTKGSIVIDAWVGCFNSDQIQQINQIGAMLYRIDMSGMIHGEIAATAAMKQLVRHELGLVTVEGLAMASGGLVAPEGTVIVDSYTKPTKIFGVADGRGFLIPDGELTDEYAERMATIQKHILNSSVNS